MLRNTFSMEHFRQRLAQSEALPQMVFLGVVCGVVCGVILGAFRMLVEMPLEQVLPDGKGENFEALPSWLHFSLPVIGSLILIAILSRVSPLNRKVGIAHLLERMAYHQGHLPIGNAVLQFLLAPIALLFGHSAGKEGPAVHIGAACGSQLGQRFHLPNNTLRILAGCGTAAGIAAMFNTPLAGVVFAMEVVLLEYTVIGFMPVMVAAATAALIVQLLFGQEIVLNLATMQIESLHEIPYVVFLGVIIGLLAAIFIWLMRQTLKWSDHSVLTYRSKLLLAGLLTGGTAIYFPQIMGVGYDTVAEALHGELIMVMLVGIMLAKLIITPIILGLGVPAGLIGPTIFIGALAGGMLGIIGQGVVERDVAHSGFYALLGMGAMMGAVTNAPLAALIAILELSGNPNIIFPAMISIVIANLITRYFFQLPSVFVATMQLQGLDYRYRPLTQALSATSVESLMDTGFIKCDRQMSAQGAMQALDTHPNWILVGQQSDYTLLSPGDLHSQASDSSDPSTQLDLLEMPAMRFDTHPIGRRATLQEALNSLADHDIDVLCIQNDQQQVVGILTREQIEDFYRQN